LLDGTRSLESRTREAPRLFLGDHDWAVHIEK
jgi:hypothetical protein